MTTEPIDCCICYETIGDKNNCVTPCGHKFCFVCLTKSLTTNNTCPCCREVLVARTEEDDEDSSYETETESETESEPSNIPPEDWVDISELSLDEIIENGELMYDEMIEKGVTKTEILRLLISYYFGRYNYDFKDQANEIDTKIDNTFGSVYADKIREKRKNNERMMMLSEDKIENINALDMIAINY
jgi:hypothetical protein